MVCQVSSDELWGRFVICHGSLKTCPTTHVTRRTKSDKALDPSGSLTLLVGLCRGGLLSAFDGVQLLPLPPQVKDEARYRSDNRGSESIFPLYLFPAAGEPEPNLAPAWIASLEDRIRGKADPRQVGAFVYAQIQSDRYQQRFADNLRQEFPRVFLPDSAELYEVLVEHGLDLLRLHLTPAPVSAEAAVLSSGEESSFTIKPPFPRWCDGALQLTEEIELPGVSQQDWEFHVGSHQVCRKWWRDRRGRRLGRAEIAFFNGVLLSIQQTQAIRAAIPGDVNHAGLWA